MILSLLACLPDDVGQDGVPLARDSGDPGDTGDTDDTGEPAGAGSLRGSWVSEGADVSELFAAEPFSIARIDATFEGDGTYRVDAENTDGERASFAGTYVVGDQTAPGSITLSQSVPSTATAVGIWQVDGDTLRYEVAQTVPDSGYTPPTTSSGFGTTTGGGMAAGANVQTYVRD